MGSKKTNFTKEIIADTADKAKELTYTIIGSKHRTKRNRIAFSDIEEILPEEVIDPIVKHIVEAKNYGNE